MVKIILLKNLWVENLDEIYIIEQLGGEKYMDEKAWVKSRCVKSIQVKKLLVKSIGGEF